MTAYQTQTNKNQFTDKPTLSLCINHNQAALKLKALGYNRGDVTCVRAFLSNEDLWCSPNTGRKGDKLNREQIHRRNQGYSATKQYLERTESLVYASREGVR